MLGGERIIWNITEILIFLNLTYGNLKEDLITIGTFALAKSINLISQEEFEDVKVALKNVISALEKYENMYYKEYIHHMDYKEHLAKAQHRALYFENRYYALADKIGLTAREVFEHNEAFKRKGREGLMAVGEQLREQWKEEYDERSE